jgi:predicted lipid-binding transport protein (Tim44 family)
MTESMARVQVLAQFRDRPQAEAAVRALEDAGVPRADIHMDEHDDEIEVAERQMHDATNAAVFGPGVLAPPATKRAAVFGSMLGAVIGGAIGLFIGWLIFGHWGSGMMATVIACAVAGTVAIALWSVFSAAEEEKDLEDASMETGVIVGVHATDEDEAARAEAVLKETNPLRVDVA